MKCLETRTNAQGFKKRRYQDGAIRLSTIEVPVELWNWLNNQGRSQNRLAEVRRAQARLRVKAQANAHWLDGWKTIASAHELGVSVRTMNRWRKQFEEGN